MGQKGVSRIMNNFFLIEKAKEDAEVTKLNKDTSRKLPTETEDEEIKEKDNEETEEADFQEKKSLSLSKINKKHYMMGIVLLLSTQSHHCFHYNL